jgi:hypothetical protein
MSYQAVINTRVQMILTILLRVQISESERRMRSWSTDRIQ